MNSRMRNLLLLMCLGFGLGLVPPVPIAAADPLTKEDLAAFFDTELPRQLADENLVRATVVLVIQGDTQVYAEGYGYADLRAQTPVDADRTLFYIGSRGWRVHYSLIAIVSTAVLASLVCWNLIDV